MGGCSIPHQGGELVNATHYLLPSIVYLQQEEHLRNIIKQVCQIILTLRKNSRRNLLFQKCLQRTVVSVSIRSTTVYVIVLIFSELHDTLRIFILTFSVFTGILQAVVLLLVKYRRNVHCNILPNLQQIVITAV